MPRTGALLGLLLAASRAGGQAPPTFGTGVDAVYVDAFVTSRGKAVVGLRAEDFEVTDNSVRQAVSLVQTERVGVAALLLFDTSGSMLGTPLRDLKAAGYAFVDGLGAFDAGGLLAFSHELSLKSRVTPDRARLYEALDLLEADGATSLFDALYVALKRPPEKGRPLIVLFTDGQDCMSWLGAEDVLQAARESSAVVYVVSAGEAHNADARFLEQLAETTGGRSWPAVSSGNLRQRFLDILSAMKTRYLLSYEPRGVTRTGRHQLKVTVKGRKVDVRHRREYVVPGSKS